MFKAVVDDAGSVQDEAPPRLKLRAWLEAEARVKAPVAVVSIKAVPLAESLNGLTLEELAVPRLSK